MDNLVNEFSKAIDIIKIYLYSISQKSAKATKGEIIKRVKIELIAKGYNFN